MAELKIRLPDYLKAEIQTNAKKLKLSTNDYCKQLFQQAADISKEQSISYDLRRDLHRLANSNSSVIDAVNRNSELLKIMMDQFADLIELEADEDE